MRVQFHSVDHTCLGGPLAAEPAVEEVVGGLGLVVGNHVASLVDLHKGEVLSAADVAVVAAIDGELGGLGLCVLGLALPLELLDPGAVAKPVADEVGVTGVDENGDLLEQGRDEVVHGLHPVTLEEELHIDVGVAALVGVDFDAEGALDSRVVEVVGDVLGGSVAEVLGVLALLADVVDVHACLLVRANELTVAVDGGRDTGPSTVSVVARLDEGLAAGQGIVHGLALLSVEDSGVATLAAGHGAVVGVLGEAVSQTVADNSALEVDVAVLVGENLSRKGRDIVSAVRLASNVKVALGVLGVLVEEEGEQGVDVLAGSNGVVDAGATVRVADVDGLVKEDDGGVGVP